MDKIIDRITALLKPIFARDVAPVPEWITIDPYKGTARYYWKAINRIYFDPGNTVVYAYQEKEDGSPSTNGQPTQKNGGITPLRVEMKDGRAVSTFQMTGDSSFDPQRNERGPYSLYMFGESDVVTGIGLPLKQHVELHVTFRWTLNDAPPPVTPPDGNHYVTEMELPGLVRQILIDQLSK